MQSITNSSQLGVVYYITECKYTKEIYKIQFYYAFKNLKEVFGSDIRRMVELIESLQFFLAVNCSIEFRHVS